jgi:hypothetical protein
MIALPLAGRLRSALRPFALAVAVAAVGLAGCDSSNPGGTLVELDGSYVLETLVFDHRAKVIPDADIAARLEPDVTRLEIFAGNGRATLISQFLGQGRRLNNLTAAGRRGSVTLTAATALDQQNLADLYLPSSFSLGYTPGDARELRADIPLTGVNLERFDPQRYQTLTNETGTLRVRFVRR